MPLNMKPFAFMCQKVLPLTFDDSLSYYECLCKIVNKLNEVIEELNKQAEIIKTLVGGNKE